MNRYLSGLCVAGLGLCAGGWLIVAAVAFGGKTASRAGQVNLLTGAGLIAVCCLSLVCWSFAWRQRMRVDGVLTGRRAVVSKRNARRNRRALGRDVRRAGKLAEQSSRDARRSARRSARAGSGAMRSGGGPGENGARSAAAILGSASPADEPRSVAVSYGPGANGTDIKGIGVNRSGGTGMNGNGVNGSAGAAVNGSAEQGAAELISQLRELLVPLLSATESQGATGNGGRELFMPERLGAGAPPAVGSRPTLAGQAGASGLPQRTPAASAFRPRATVPMPRVESGPTPARQAPTRPTTMPYAGVRAVDDGLGVPVDGKEAWW